MSGRAWADAPPCADGRPRDPLSSTHRQELEGVSVIDPAVIAERGYRTLLPEHRDELAMQGIVLRSIDSFPGLLLPMFRATGERISAQFKPAHPTPIKGKAVKYLSPRGQTNRIDVHPRNSDRVRDPLVPLWITEGIKKSDSLTSQGCCVAALTGVYNWRSTLGTLGDWEDMPLKGREVILCFDADTRTNMNVARAMVRLGRWCRSKGATVVRYLIVPAEVCDTRVKGVDDYLAAGGGLNTLIATATTTEPDTAIAHGTFSDSTMAEVTTDDVLADRFCWSKGLGWMGWDETRWAAVTEETVGEAVRQYVVEHFKKAAPIDIKGWVSMLGVGRQRAVLTLARGIVERQAEEFDADPDALNTPTGVVDLRTGRIAPHDPKQLYTKITTGNYRPEYVHPDWARALSALPEDVRPWLQVRIGQAITGHMTPDGVLPIAQGSGENGKSCVLTDGILPALGDYAAPASPKLIAANTAEHSTERADLRGQRFLIAEELTEDRALNVTAIKQIQDVSRIKARYLYKDNVTFNASHSLFITTNYRPVVTETDHGTWRRLALVVFPYTYRKPDEPHLAPTDRLSDPQLKARLRAGVERQRDAVVTWAVEGARRWYATGMPSLPSSVEADTREWRTDADRILGFWDDRLIADPETGVVTTELHAAFNTWIDSNGHTKWSKELFGSRFRSHAETTRHRVVERRPRDRDAQWISRSSGSPAGLPVRPRVYVGVRFRDPGEINENTRENGKGSNGFNHSGTALSRDDAGEVKQGVGRVDHGCCEGKPLQLKCQLCRRSPTYWRHDKAEGTEASRS